MKSLLVAVLFLALPQSAVKPLNVMGAAVDCKTKAECTYTDTAVPAGPHFYFVVAQNLGGPNGTVAFSGPSNRVDVVVPADGKLHTVVLNWDPQNVTPAPSYYVYRGAPATGLTGKPQ